MDNKLKAFGTIVLCKVILFLGVVLGLLWTMPDLPTSPTYNQICIPNKEGILECGVTHNLLSSYLEKVRFNLKFTYEIGTLH